MGAAGPTRRPPSCVIGTGYPSAPVVATARRRRRRVLGLAQRRATRSFGPVLALIVASVVFAMTAPEAAWTAGVLVLLQSATLVTALWAAGLARADSPLSVGLLVLSVAAAAASLATGGAALVGLVSLLSGVLTVGVANVIALTVVRQRDVNLQSIRGAICVYLLLGLFFMFVYGVVAWAGAGPLFAQGTDGTRALRAYFSFVTLATLGYGDFTPSGEVGRMLAVLEALAGQLYLVTVVALLVARIGPRRPASPAPDEDSLERDADNRARRP
jgi:hypothetical protein